MVFSSFVTVLRVVQYFLNKITNKDSIRNAEALGLTKFNSKWKEGTDYYVLDGTTSKQDRYDKIKKFNDENDERMRLFLISAKAGGIGINLCGANRCVILGRFKNTKFQNTEIEF